MDINEIKIPKKRIAVLIGEKGKDKRRLEKLSECKVEVNSEGEVIIKGEDSLKCFECLNVVKAIGRGCKPDIAFSLLNEKNCSDILNITEYSGKNKLKQKRIKARIIGTGGKVRKTIEDLTETYIVIYGKTVCIVGPLEGVAIARGAVNDILKGAPVGPVYSVIEKKMKRLKAL
ncbi:MAG: KH domain-containing protein [Nanoarchaeota archaeon]|nr:KH domain-containing protein [Nanoarchaeota archaeon]